MRNLNIREPGDYEAEFIKAETQSTKEWGDFEVITLRADDGEMLTLGAGRVLKGVSDAARDAQKGGFRVRLCIRSRGMFPTSRGRMVLDADWAIGRYAQGERAPVWSWCIAGKLSQSLRFDS